MEKSRQEEPDEVFMSKWGTFFDICNVNLNPNLYYLIYFFRRAVLVLVITAISNPFLQLSISFTVTLIVISTQLPIYILITDALSTHIMKWYIIFNEVLLAMFYAFISVDLFRGLDTMSSDIEDYCVKVILAAICSNALLSLIQGGHSIVNGIKYIINLYRNRKSKVWAMHTTTNITGEDKIKPMFQEVHITGDEDKDQENLPKINPNIEGD